LIKYLQSYLRHIFRRQEGAILVLAVIAAAVGVMIAVPLAVLVSTASSGQGDLEDVTRDFYTSDAAIHAVIGDLIRGADGDPVPPHDYIPPVVNFVNVVPTTSVRVLEPPTLATVKPVTYGVAGNPQVSPGTTILQGAGQELADLDRAYLRLLGGGDPETVVYEVTSQPVLFTKADFAEVKLTVQAWEESATLEVFVYNLAGTGHGGDGYSPTPDATFILDHDHLSNIANHTHDEGVHDHHNHNKKGVPHDHLGQEHHHHVQGGVSNHILTVADHDHHHHCCGDEHHHGHHHGSDDGSHHTDHDTGGHLDGDLDHHVHVTSGGDAFHLHLHDSAPPHGHDHESHSHDLDDTHNGETTVSFFLSQEDIDRLNTTATNTITIKIKATVYPDPDHHEHVHNLDDSGSQGKNHVHDHVHHYLLNPPRVLNLWTDQIVFVVTGPATVDHRFTAGEPVINSGTLLSGSGNDLRINDLSYFTVDTSGNRVEFEVTSENFVFPRLDTLTVSYVVRSSEVLDQVSIFVFNPAGTGHGPSGYASSPDLKEHIKLADTDRTLTFALAQEDIAYLNTLPAGSVSVTIKIQAKFNTVFRLESDRLAFIATTTDVLTFVDHSGEVKPTPVRSVTHQFVDPGLRNPEMAVIPPGTGYLLRIYNVHPGIMNVNWAFAPVLPSGQTYAGDHDSNDAVSIRVYRGLVVHSDSTGSWVEVPPGRVDRQQPPGQNTLVAQAHVHDGGSFVRTGFFEVDSGIYSVVFFNDRETGDGFTVDSNPFAAPGIDDDTGIDERTWIYAAAYKDYLVDSKVGNLAARAVLRQIPGPTEPTDFPWSPGNISWIENLVTIESWEPRGFVEALGDADDDGINDLVDSIFTNGVFVDQSDVPSSDFTDQNLDGSTFGSIVERAGLHVAVIDSNDPAIGLLISATGSGEGTATLSACDATVLIIDGVPVNDTTFQLAAGDFVSVTCTEQ